VNKLKSTHKCLKEWNATIEALGQGKQAIIIRNYKTNVNEFLLYPTVSYALKDDYLDSFQENYHDFVENNALPEKNDAKVLIKYFATMEKITEKPFSWIPSSKYYIWTREHIKSYMTGKTAFIWILRVYKLKEPHWAEPTPGAIKYANLKDDVSLEGIEPVLSDNVFFNLVNGLFDEISRIQSDYE
jgi:restriction system protein